jgi:hypothetical protein
VGYGGISPTVSNTATPLHHYRSRASLLALLNSSYSEYTVQHEGIDYDDDIGHEEKFRVDR